MEKVSKYFFYHVNLISLIFFLFFSSLTWSKNIYSYQTFFLKLYSKSERGLEIRYFVSKKKSDKLDDEILIDGIKYAIYATKEIAIEAITNSNLKKDYTIVYVYSEKQKETEIISIEE